MSNSTHRPNLCASAGKNRPTYGDVSLRSSGEVDVVGHTLLTAPVSSFCIAAISACPVVTDVVTRHGADRVPAMAKPVRQVVGDILIQEKLHAFGAFGSCIWPATRSSISARRSS